MNSQYEIENVKTLMLSTVVTTIIYITDPAKFHNKFSVVVVGNFFFLNVLKQPLLLVGV